MVEYVYVDSDVSSLAKKFPIDVHDSEVSGIACWSHLQSQTGGALEHWAIAFMPHHPNITEAGVSVSQLVVYKLQHPEFLLRNDTKEAEAEDPWTMRLTGPAMYQYTLHRLCYRNRSVRRYWQFILSCTVYNPDPGKHCNNMDTFRTFFPNDRKVYEGSEFC